MEIHVLSKSGFDQLMLKHGVTDENVEERTSFFAISIHGTSEEYGEIPHFKKNHHNVLNLSFDDVMEDIPRKGARAMSREQAVDLYRFMDSIPDDSKVFIHCAAGISRSGAVGTFLNDLKGGDYFHFKKKNPQVQPNQQVISLLREVAIENFLRDS